MQNYQIIIWTPDVRLVRNITAPNRRKAMSTALDVLGDDEIPLAVICKTHAEACGLPAGEQVS